MIFANPNIKNKADVVFRCLTIIVTVILSFLDIGWVQASPKKDSKDYNVILIVVDALRADHLGCYGYFLKTSPNIDDLARKGVLFSQAYSQATWTLPSFASLFTSRYMPQHKVFNKWTKLDDSELTLAETLKIFGYKTAAFTAGIFLSKIYNFYQGFDVYQDLFMDDNAYFSSMPVIEWLRTRASKAHPPKRSMGEMYPNIEKWLKENKDKKFFLFIHMMDVHPPLHLPDDGDDNMFDPGYKGRVDTLNIDMSLRKDNFGNMIFFHNGSSMELSKKDIQHIVSRYDAAIYYEDGYIGRLLNKLQEMGLAENSIIILTADHGIDLFNHNSLFSYAAQAPYEELIHVPLIIFHSDLGHKKIITAVESIDILPTLLDLLKIPPKKDAEGKSLLPLMKRDKEIVQKGAIYSMSSAENNTDIWRCSYSIRASDWKLLMRPYSKYLSVYELYNIKDDPLELRDRINDNVDERNGLLIKLKNWLREQGVKAPDE